MKLEDGLQRLRVSVAVQIPFFAELSIPRRRNRQVRPMLVSTSGRGIGATVTRSEKLHQQAEEAEALLNIAIATTDGKTTHWYLASCASPVIVARYRG